jgi:hypothetical protein
MERTISRANNRVSTRFIAGSPCVNRFCHYGSESVAVCRTTFPQILRYYKTMGEELQINIPKRAAVVFYKKTIDIIQKIKYTVQRRVKGNISVCRKGGRVQ